MENATNGQVEGKHQEEKDEESGLLPHKVPAQVKSNIIKRCVHDPLHRRKVLHSVWIALVFISLGTTFGQSGPTLLDLQILTNTDLETASFFLTASSIGYLAGSTLCGIIYDRVNKNLLLLIGVFGLGLFNIVTPYCFNFVAMILIRAFAGIFVGVVDTAGNAEQMRVWGNEGQELMQLLHFCFAIGGVISPLYTEPFLAQKEATNVTDGNPINITDQQAELPSMHPTTTNVQYAFIITGCLCFVSGIPWLFVYVQSKLGTKLGTVKADGAVPQRKIPLPLLLFMLFMICIIYVLYCWAEVSFTSYLMTFLVKEYNETKSRGAHVTSVFWALFAASRFSMIFISQILTAVQLLYISCVLMLITSVCFTISAAFGVVDALMVFTALLGLSVSAVFPAAFSWTESELMRVTSRVSASIHVSSSIGGMISPLLLGYLMENVSNMWFCYLLIIEIALMCLVFLILLLTARCFINKRYVFRNEPSTVGELTVSVESKK